MESILEGCEGTVCYMDDVVVSGETMEEHDKNLEIALDKIAKSGLKLNESKCEFRKDRVKFLGHEIGPDGLKPDTEKIKSITDMAAPKDIGDLRRFLGMVGYLGRFIPNLATELRSLNLLLNKNTSWVWGPDQQNAFAKVKQLISSSDTLRYFDCNRKTVVCSDSSSFGLGGVLYQEIEGELRPIAFCSRTLSETERKYAQIEKECLGIVYTCEKFERFLVGLPTFEFITDHRPLVPMINSKDLHDTPLRCQRMLMRLMRYNLVAKYAPGKTLIVADTLSRSPIKDCQTRESVALQSDVEIYANSVRDGWSVSENRLKDLKEATRNDTQLSSTLDYIRNGWPLYKSDARFETRQLYSIKDELSECDGLVVRGHRIVIPQSMRSYVLGRIHDGHLGITKSRQRANEHVWWPGMSTEISDLIEKCRVCEDKRPAQIKEPMTPTTSPDYPFQKVGIDLFEFGNQQYLILVDYYSRWIEYAPLLAPTTAHVVMALKRMFAAHGIPEVVFSDNGPQLTSFEFQRFARDWKFKQVTSSPRYAQSNGEAERAVKTAKAILRQSDPDMALLAYRSAPIPSLGSSPSQLAAGRRLRTTIPSLPNTLTTNPQCSCQFQSIDKAAREKQKYYYDRRNGVKELPELLPGMNVRIEQPGCTGKEKWSEPAMVQRQCAPRSYEVETSDGRTFRRNRRHLISTHQPMRHTHKVPFNQTAQGEPNAPDTTVPGLPPTNDTETSPMMNPNSSDVPRGQVTTRSGRISRPPAKLEDYELS